jgi:DNA polymerase-3 subunit epsilon
MNLNEVFQKYKAVVFFDTETSGLDAGKCQIIELAAIRYERNPRGVLYVADSCDLFVKLPEGQQIPEKIVELTGITDAMLEAEGVSEDYAAGRFTEIIGADKGPVLLVAHNAQFDLLFVREMMWRRPLFVPADDGVNMRPSCVRQNVLAAADYLDSLTVYKDRRAYPHKLANAIQDYNLQDKVQNSHRAIDDVAALFEVVKAMDNERADLLTYVNIFGYNPKYGVSGPKIDKVKYWPQQFNNYMQAPNYTLPAKVRRGW